MFAVIGIPMNNIIERKKIMGLQFKPGASAQPAAQPAQEIETTATVTADPTDTKLAAQIEEVKNFNIAVKTDEIKQQLATSQDIDRLVSTINLN